MAKKERQKRAARKARQAERAEHEQLEAAQKGDESKKGSKALASSQEQSPKKAKKDKSGKRGPFKRLRSYFSDVRSEMHRVVWPSRGELRSYSVATIVMLIVAGFVIWAVDTGVLALLAGYTGLRG